MPLKSNVRPRFKPHHESTSAIHCTARAFVRGAVAASPSRLARPAKGASQGWRRLSVLRRPAHGCVVSQRMRSDCPSACTLSIEEPNFTAASLLQGQESLAFLALSIHRRSSSISRAARAPALVCFATRIRSKVASPRAWPNPSFKRTRLRRSA